MRGIVWDDLDRGVESSYLEMKSLYNRLGNEFLNEGVDLEVYEDHSEFLRQFRMKRFDFALIDLMHATEGLVGIEYAREIRRIAAEDDLYRDDGFPIFLISKELGKGRLDLLADLRVMWIDKQQAPSLIIHTIKMVLLPEGRWTPGSQSFIIARMGGVSYGSEKFDEANFLLLHDICRESGLEPNLLEMGEVLDRDLMERINRKILTTRKIITLITRDEKLVEGSDPPYMSRPNIYLELGLVAARPSTLRRTLLLVQKGVAFPSDFGGRLRLDFEDSLNEIRESIVAFLRRPD
jgi:hypothetical protein